MPRKHVAPSRERYEESHPTVSFRLTKEDLERLRAEQERSKSSLAEIALRGVVLEQKMQESYLRGYRDGFRKSFGRFAVPCRRCDTPMFFDLQHMSTRQIVLPSFARHVHLRCLEKHHSAQDDPTRRYSGSR